MDSETKTEERRPALLAVRTTGLAPAPGSTFRPVVVDIAAAVPSVGKAWHSRVRPPDGHLKDGRASRAMAENFGEAAAFQSAPDPESVRAALLAFLERHNVGRIAVWSGDFEAWFLGRAPWDLHVRFPALLSLQDRVREKAPAGVFRSAPTLDSAAAWASAALDRPLWPTDRKGRAVTALETVSAVAGIAEALRLKGKA
jgi:hypothetical protein